MLRRGTVWGGSHPTGSSLPARSPSSIPEDHSDASELLRYVGSWDNVVPVGELPSAGTQFYEEFN